MWYDPRHFQRGHVGRRDLVERREARAAGIAVVGRPVAGRRRGRGRGRRALGDQRRRSPPSRSRGTPGPGTFGASRSSTTRRARSLARLVAVAAIGEHLAGVVAPPAAEHRDHVGLLLHHVLVGDSPVALDAVDLGRPGARRGSRTRSRACRRPAPTESACPTPRTPPASGWPADPSRSPGDTTCRWPWPGTSSSRRRRG